MVYLAGLSVALHYVFTTNYLAVYDSRVTYTLYNYYRESSMWHFIGQPYVLQNSCLFDTYVPAVLQSWTRVPSEVFYKLYSAMVIACVPMVAYFIGKRVCGIACGLWSAVLVASWVTFYQGGSFLRQNIAVAIYGLTVLAILTMPMRMRWKLPLVVVLSALLVVSHYGVVVIAVLTFVGVGILLFALGRWRMGRILLPLALALVILVVGIGYWHGVVNYPYKSWEEKSGQVMGMPYFVDNMVAKFNQGDSDSGKITQAAFGVKNPDGDESWTLNWWLLGFAWLVMVLMVWGYVYSWKPEIFGTGYGMGYLALTTMAGISIICAVLIPVISGAYGLEKVYYQAVIVLAPCLYVGAYSLSGRLKLNPNLILAVVVLPYTYLMYNYGVIPSILG